MPTTTFYNLPEEKQSKLRQAIRDEFARVPLEQLSINRIIRQAEIPRGSYYQYFSDKRDLLQYVTDDFRQVFTDCAKEKLILHRGDVFKAWMDMFDVMVDFGLEKENQAISRHIFAYLRVDADGPLQPIDLVQELKQLQLLSLIDRQKLNADTEEQVFEIIELLMAMMCWAIACVLAQKKPKEKMRKKFGDRLDMIKRGLGREDI